MINFTKFQSLYRGTAFATLQGNNVVKGIRFPFQSLYRGTAFATDPATMIVLAQLKFQSLYRGTAFATQIIKFWSQH